MVRGGGNFYVELVVLAMARRSLAFCSNMELATACREGFEQLLQTRNSTDFAAEAIAVFQI